MADIRVKGHEQIFMSGMKRALETGSHKDLTISVGNSTFPCHRVVVMATCPYLKARMSAEEVGGTLTIDGIDEKAFRELIGYMYSGGVPDINLESMEPLVNAADVLQMTELKTEWDNRLRKTLQFNSSNCINLWNSFTKLDLKECKRAASSYVRLYLSRMLRAEEINVIELSLEQMKEIVHDTGLILSSHRQLLTLITDWLVHHDQSTHEDKLALLSSVSWSKVTKAEVTELLSGEKVSKSAELCKLITEQHDKGRDKYGRRSWDPIPEVFLKHSEFF